MTMNKFKNGIYFFTLFLFSLFVMIPQQIVLAESEANGSGADFGVSVVYPENQIASTSGQGYFDIKVKPNDKQDIKVTVSNYSETKTITVNAEINRGLTTDTGALSYQTPKKFDTFKIKDQRNFYSIATLKEKQIKLKPTESKDVTISLDIPAGEFDGIVLGGVHFTQEPDEEETKDQQVVNQFAYSVPIIISENDKAVENALSFKKVYPKLRNYHPFIEAILSNNTATLIHRLQVDARIVDRQTNESVYVNKQDRMQMAPMSDFNFGFDLRDSSYVPGKYQLIMKVDADGIKKEFSEDFEITKKESDELNEESVIAPKEKNKLLWIIIAVVVLVILIIIAILVIMKVKKNKKKSKSKNRKKKGKTSKHSNQSKKSTSKKSSNLKKKKK